MERYRTDPFVEYLPQMSPSGAHGQSCPKRRRFVTGFFVVEFIQQTSELGGGGVVGWFNVNSTCLISNEREPLLPFASTVSADKVFVQ